MYHWPPISTLCATGPLSLLLASTISALVACLRVTHTQSGCEAFTCNIQSDTDLLGERHLSHGKYEMGAHLKTSVRVIRLSPLIVRSAMPNALSDCPSNVPVMVLCMPCEHPALVTTLHEMHCSTYHSNWDTALSYHFTNARCPSSVKAA